MSYCSYPEIPYCVHPYSQFGALERWDSMVPPDPIDVWYLVWALNDIDIPGCFEVHVPGFAVTGDTPDGLTRQST